MNKAVVITPNPWLVPMTEELPQIKTELAKVITESENCNHEGATDREQNLVSQWCGCGESNSNHQFGKLG